MGDRKMFYLVLNALIDLEMFSVVSVQCLSMPQLKLIDWLLKQEFAI